MQCFMCVTYMIILCSANPMKTREMATTHEKRSLFRDVIESLRIHTHIPEDLNQNDENDLSHNYRRFGFDNDPAYLPSDSEFAPRRNDRIEMPSLKYRFPKSVDLTSNDKIESKDVIVRIDTNGPKQTTQKPKKDKTYQRPTVNRVKVPNKVKQNEEVETTETDPDDIFPFTNWMNGQSQIGHRESQTVLKPTVIVNIRGSVSHRDSDIRLEARDESNNNTVPWQNIFNINQEVKIGKDVEKKKTPVQQEIKTIPSKETPKVEENVMMCETAKSKYDESHRKFDNAFQILFTV